MEIGYGKCIKVDSMEVMENVVVLSVGNEDNGNEIDNMEVMDF